VTLAAKQERDAAFARSGASAVGDAAEDAGAAAPPAEAAVLAIGSVDELALIEQMAALSDAERAALEDDVRRWRGMSEEARDAVRERWRGATQP